MAGYQIIADVSGYLLRKVRGAVCPGLLAHAEQVSLDAPDRRDSEALLGICLYSIKDHADFQPGRLPSVAGNSVWEAPMAISLSYLVYFSSHAQTRLDLLTEQQVLGRVLQLLYTEPVVSIAEIHAEADAGDEPASISFQRLDDHQKQLIWSGFSEPMRPALYFEVGPLLIRGGKGTSSRVRTAEGEVRRA